MTEIGIVYFSGMWAGYFSEIENDEATLLCAAFCRDWQARTAVQLSPAENADIDEQIAALSASLPDDEVRRIRDRVVGMDRIDLIDFCETTAPSS